MLYAQNAKTMVKNAIWLTIMTWVLGVVVFFLTLAPAGAILYAMPGELGGWAFVLAIVFAWAFISAFVEPFVIAALMQVYFRRSRDRCPIPPGTCGSPRRRSISASSRTARLASVGGSRWGGVPEAGQSL